MVRASASFLAFGLAVACNVPVAANLDEADANQAVVLLEHGGVGADKERDPEHEDRFRVSVLSGDASRAIGLLADQNLPPRSSPGVLEALGSGSVVPSRLAEHAKWTAGIAGDLERSLRSIDGVLSVRVHLAVPPKQPLDLESENPKPSASVLVRHRGVTPPVRASEIQRLVAGAVPGLGPDQVNVVLAESPAIRAPEGELSRLGPLMVTRGSRTALKLVMGGAALLNLILLFGVLFLWTRLRRTEVLLLEARGERDAERPERR